jgi:sugar O-acyltransferase (sialic acid O-acetyltransferase NeuD family)
MTLDANIELDVFGLFGVGGFGREVMGFIRSNPWPDSPDVGSGMRTFFVDVTPPKDIVNGIPVISERDYFALACRTRYFNVAIGDSRLRETIAAKCIAAGARPLTLRSQDSVVYDGNDIGEGAIICAYTVITSNAVIGKFFHANLYSYVAHDCLIGDYVTFAPRVHCNGNVHIRNHAYIGTGAIIINGTPENPIVIGESAVVGMGAVVTRSVAPRTTVVGVPAKPIAKI